uniref:Retrotransposon gag domain-containing protein n=1 Tax=Tanacetum cinerariifolium TaxID=118510 RepID=A0A6L2KVV6_TANCI|nr:hypothetical protein [Tanacetum cinerariifolium]
MANLPPPNNDLNIPEHKHTPDPEHALIAPNPTPIQPDDYLADNKEPKEEEEPIPNKLMLLLMGLLLNDESEFAPSVVPVFDAKNRPVPPVIHFSCTYERGESSSAREILKDIGEVYLFGLVPLTIRTSMKCIRRLNEKMRERAEVDERIVKKIHMSDLGIWIVGRDAMSLDGAVRECQANVSKVISMTESMSLEFDRVRKESYQALELVEWEAGDDDDDDMDDVVADPSDLQSSEPRGSPPSIAKLVSDEVAKALAANRATRNTTGDRGSANVGGTGAIKLCCWYEKIECTFRISECAERNKGKFSAATLQCRALTWWNTQVATLGLAVANERSWDDLKRMMLEEFCPEEEISRMKDEFRHLRLKDNDIATYTNRFNELVLLCLNVVPSTKKKIGQYIKGLPSCIKGETYASKTTTLNEAVRMAHGLMEHKIQGHVSKCNRCNMFHFRNFLVTCHNYGKRGHKAKSCHREGVATGANTEPIKVCYKCGDQNHLANSDLCPERKKQGGRNASGHVYAVKDAEQAQGSNVVTNTFLLNNCYFSMLFDSGSDKSFINASLTHLFDIELERISTSYKVELADGRIVSTNIVLKGCTLNLVNHLFEIDLMPIELGTFDVITGMDWLVALDAVIVCGKKEVHTPVKNRTLVVKGDSNPSRSKVISCIKARKYIERGCHLFLAHVTEKEKSEKHLEDVPIIHDFPEVFPNDLSGLPPPQQVEFIMDLVPGAAPITRAPYRLAPSETKELSEQL